MILYPPSCLSGWCPGCWRGRKRWARAIRTAPSSWRIARPRSAPRSKRPFVHPRCVRYFHGYVLHCADSSLDPFLPPSWFLFRSLMGTLASNTSSTSRSPGSTSLRSIDPRRMAGTRSIQASKTSSSITPLELCTQVCHVTWERRWAIVRADTCINDQAPTSGIFFDCRWRFLVGLDWISYHVSFCLFQPAGDLKPALAKSLNLILQPVRDHFENDAEAKELLKKVKSYKVTKWCP